MGMRSGRSLRHDPQLQSMDICRYLAQIAIA
jgi:hypothetical protein